MPSHRLTCAVRYAALLMAPLAIALAQPTPAPTPVQLNLAQAVAIAIKNHPQIAESQNVAAAADQRVTQARAPFYPVVDGEVTTMQAQNLSRLGAGSLSASALFDRFGSGLQMSQLVTDFGRTKNLVANARYNAQAAAQSTQGTIYDVVLGVNQAYYGLLQAQAFVQVANE